MSYQTRNWIGFCECINLLSFQLLVNNSVTKYAPDKVNRCDNKHQTSGLAAHRQQQQQQQQQQQKQQQKHCERQGITATKLYTKKQRN